MKNELQKALVKFAKINPLYYAFVTESIARYSDQLLKDEAATIKAMSTSFVSGEAWVSVAKEMSEAVKI